MKVEIKVPEMGESVNEATVAAILKSSGTYVKMDDEIVELETDKVNQVLSAPKDGVINITVSVDDTVTIGQVIGHIETDAQAPAAEAVVEAPPPPPSEPKKVVSPPAPTQEGPSARYTAEEYAKDVGVEKPVEALKPVASTGERETRKKMPKIRQTIARRLVEAQQTTAMLTTFNEVDMTAVMELRAKYKDEFLEKHGVKLGFMSFFVKAVVAALQEIPAINSSIDGNEFVQRNYYDIGIAVSTDRGLMVPVVRDCDKLSFAGIEAAIGDFAKRARASKIKVDEITGGGFTITNGGVFGSLLSTPILNTPQSGILGMHAIQKRPVAIDGEVVIRPMMYVALSYDHRAVDGRESVTFLVRLKHYLENPSTFFLDL